MTSFDQGPDISQGYWEPEPPARAYRKVPKPGVLNRFFHREMLVELPQFDPAAHRGQNFDFATLVATGALRPEAPTIVDEAGAIALRARAEQEHRDQAQQPLPPESPKPAGN